MDFVKATKPDPVVAVKAAIVPAPTTQAPPAPPPTTAASSPKAQPTTSSGSGSGGAKSFCGGGKYKRATIAQIGYQGNIGSSGNYACNLMMVDNAADYKYTTTFNNKSGKDQTCVVWLKIGPDGGINGFFKNNQALTFDLPAGGSKVLAADANTQGGAACGVGSVPTTSFGQYASTWVEFDFANESNGGSSGADASCLVSAANSMSIPALSVCDASTCSTIHQGGTGTNAYLAGMEAADGIGLNLVPGKVALQVNVG